MPKWIKFVLGIIFRTAKQTVKERPDITGSNCLKGALGKMIVDEKGIKD